MHQTSAPTAEERLAQFRDRRDNTVAGPQGALALVLTHWVQDPGPIDTVPGVWSVAPAPESGLLLTAAESDGIIVDGSVVDGTVVVRSQDSMTPSTLRFDESRTGTVISGPAGVALRVWDAESPAVERFDWIEGYDYDPAWVFQGRYEQLPQQVKFDRSQGGSTQNSSPGVIVVTIGGQEYRLSMLPGGDTLQLVFRDETSGAETYGVGRFLFVRPRPDGSVELDFNRAVLPPCAFSDQFNCPMAPPSNRLAVAVRAGEQFPRYYDQQPAPSA